MSSIKLLPLIVYMGLNLNFLPTVAESPEAQHYMIREHNKYNLYMEMWSNFENEQEASNQVASEGSEGLANDGTNNEYTQTVSQPEDTTEVESTGVTLPSETEPVVNAETQVEVTEVPVEVVQAATPAYLVHGWDKDYVLDYGVQEYLYQKLCEAGIGWFMPYAVLIAYGESRFDFYVVNQKNGLDMGLFQFRITYWGAGDIFNPYTQIDVFTGLMANRAAAGCSVSEMISRHKQSDYGPYDQSYVDYIMSEQGNLVQIR